MGLHQHDGVVLLLGAPGAGKGTQARFLSEALGVPHVASGDLLREHRDRGTQLGRAARSYMDRGELAPHALVVDMIVDRLAQPDATRGALLDGFPRTVAQADALEARLRPSGCGVRAALYIGLPPDVLVERLAGRWTCGACHATYHERFNPSATAGLCTTCGGELGQRCDDRREVVARRIDVYLRDTLPVIARYERQGSLRRIDGDQPIEAVRRALREALLETAAVAA